MSVGLTRFQFDLMDFADKIDASIGIVTQKVAGDLFGELTKGTPVDTGRARAGWAISQGAPSAFVPPLPPKGERVEFPPPAVPLLSGIDGSQVVYLTNNVEYIGALENGHSQQAPSGMVDIAVLTVEIELQRTLNELL